MYTIRQEDVAPRQVPPSGPASFRLPEQIGTGDTRHFEIESGLGLLETRFRLRRDFAYDSFVDAPDRVLVVTVALDGVSTFDPGAGRPIEYRKGRTTISAFSSSRGRRTYFAGGLTHQLRVFAREGWLNRNVGEKTAGELLASCATGSREGLMSAPLVALSLRGIEGLAQDDARGRLLRRGLALALISLESARAADGVRKDAASVLSPRDVSLIRKAREILEVRLEDPPTVRELARLAGLNEAKLKAGFREIYSSTPHRMLHELRMQRAWDLLSNSRCHVASAGYAVGYRHPGNFSAAFARHFGVTAKSVKRMQ